MGRSATGGGRSVRVEGRKSKFETVLYDELAEGRAKLAKTLEQGTFSQVRPLVLLLKVVRIVKAAACYGNRGRLVLLRKKSTNY